MTALSPRFAVAAMVLFIVSAIPVWFHQTQAPTYDSCADPDAFFLAPKLGGATMRMPQPRNRTSISVEGRMYTKASSPLNVIVFRTHESSRFYASPMSFGFDSMAYIIPREIRWLEIDGDVLPVHWSSYIMEGRVYIEAYLYVQGEQPIRHPLQSGLRLAAAQLVEGTRPLTVMIASADGDADDSPALSRATEEWFTQAWLQMKGSCGS